MLEKPLEKRLFACRWLLAPLYFGLSLALIVLGIKFFQEAFHVLSQVTSLVDADLVPVGSLIVMVLFSGYENLVSRLDIDIGGDTPVWLSKLDAGTLKLKVAASIVGISSQGMSAGRDHSAGGSGSFSEAWPKTYFHPCGVRA